MLYDDKEINNDGTNTIIFLKEPNSNDKIRIFASHMQEAELQHIEIGERIYQIMLGYIRYKFLGEKTVLLKSIN